MNKKLLKEYVKHAVHEAYFIRPIGKKDAEKGILSKIKDFFFKPNEADQISQDWIEEQELYYDSDFSADLKDKIKKYSKEKFSRLIQRTKGDVQKAKRQLRRSLDVKFNKEISDIKRAAIEREKAEDADID